MVIIFLLLFLIFTRPTFAADVEITDFSSNSNPEWVQLTNKTNNTINLENWYFEDESKTVKTINICLSPSSTQILEFDYSGNSGWLNNSKDSTDVYADIIYLYNSNQTLIHEYPYTNGVDKLKPPSTNICLVSPTLTPTDTPTVTPTTVPTATKTPSPTPTPISTPTSSPTPTTTANLINPDSRIILSEFMPYSSIEWIEIYNDNDKTVELKNWKIKDNSSNTKTIPDMTISPKSYGIFEFSSFLNNDIDKIILINHNNQVVGQFEYPNNKYTLERSWSFISNSWCQSEFSKNAVNVSSCYSQPTSTPQLVETVIPTSTLTPTITSNNDTLYKPDESATASAIFTPTEESGYYITPTTSHVPISSNLVLGETTTAKKNNLPLVFIISGGLLLISPIILNKLKKK